MKKFILVPAIVTLLGMNVFAAGRVDNGNTTADAPTVSRAVSRQFAADFADAKNVKWTTGNGFVKADFTVDGDKMTVFYKGDGEYIATAHELSPSILPAQTVTKLNDLYKGYTPTEVIAYAANEENTDVDPVSYFVDLKNDKHEVLVRVSLQNDIELIKTIK